MYLNHIVSATLLFIFMAFQASADDVIFDIKNTTSCLSSATSHDQKRQCIGEAAEVCMSANDLGYTTYGMGACINQEFEYWDAELNNIYREVMNAEKTDDKEMRSEGIDVPMKADALLAMQRQWIKFRDTTCAYEASQWGGGTGAGPAFGGCFLRMTGEQTLYLGSVSLN